MEKGAQLPQVITVNDKSSEAVKITKIITVGVFFTTVVTVCVFFAARPSSVVSTAPQSCPGPQRNKLMDKDMRRVRDLRKGDGQIIHEQFTYDHKSNMVMVQTPGNFSGDSPATLVIDYDRALVFAHVLDADVCYVFSLRDEVRNFVNTELFTPDEQVVDVAHAEGNDNYPRYTVAGEIPNGFVQSFSGPPMLDGMCAGRNTYWLERIDNRSNFREKRSCAADDVIIIIIICREH